MATLLLLEWIGFNSYSLDTTCAHHRQMNRKLYKVWKIRKSVKSKNKNRKYFLKEKMCGFGSFSLLLIEINPIRISTTE